MNFINLLSALLIFSFFISGFSQAFLPAYHGWDKATKEYNTAQTIHFIAESFKQECAKPDRNIENWKRSVAAVKELDSCKISELWKGDVLWALKLTCSISGDAIEVIGACTL